MDDRPIEPDDLELVLRSARYAPNAGNRRIQQVVAVEDERMLRLLRLIAPGMIPKPQAAAVICIDERRATDYGFRPATPGLYIDVGTMAATMLLAAHGLGLASCPVTSFSRAAAARLLGLESGVVPRLIVCLGHASDDQPLAMGAWAKAPRSNSV